jgi:LytS/YehU family sensor histidine kinase
LISISYFYFFSEVGLKFVFKASKHYLFFLPLVLIFLFGYVVSHFLNDNFFVLIGYSSSKLFFVLDKQFVVGQIYRAIYFMGFSTGYYFLKTYLNQKRENEILEKQRLEGIIAQQKAERDLAAAENAFLKAQINPHFLFNTLDFVYHKVEESSPEAGEAIIDLSNMMRYAMSDAKKNMTLGEEIEQVESLIHLYQLRKNNAYCIEFTYAPEVQSIPFIPLILLTLVENVFKHGDLLDPQHPAKISLSVANKNLLIRTQNKINRFATSTSNKLGLQNIENRLRQAYGDHFSFSQEVQEDLYVVEVRVFLANSYNTAS